MALKNTWKGTILRINLSTGEIKREVSDPKVLRQFIGGSGIGLKMLYDEVPPTIDPLSPQNKIFLCAGPFNGTRVPGSGIYSVVTHGAHVGGVAATQSNGFIGARMRQTGNDIIVLEGVAPEWSYVYIEDDKVEIRSAKHLVGKKLWDLQDTIKEEAGHKQTAVAGIGPAGEIGVSFAAISNDYGHVASSNGVGAVLGSKKVKAVAIYASNTNVEVNDPEELRKLIKTDFLPQAEASTLGGAIKAFGTYAYFDMLYPAGQVPVKNYTTNIWEGIDKMYGSNFYDSVERKIKPCWACPWGHCSELKYKEGAKAGIELEELEFEIQAGFTSNIGNTDMSVGTYMGNLMEDYGVDGKEFSWCIALIYECFTMGMISKEDTGGLSFNWGETDDLPELIDQICTRRGFGAMFSDGVKKGSQRLGKDAPKRAVWAGRGCAPHVTDTRGIGGWGQNLCLAMSDTGAFYGTGNNDPLVYNYDNRDPFSVEGLGAAARNGSCNWVYNDTVGACMFFLAGNQWNMCKALEHTAGWEGFTPGELYNVGDRIRAISRAYNMLSGRTRADDHVSERLKKTQVDGPGAGHDFAQHYERMVKDYLEASQYDTVTGNPLPSILERYELDYVVPDLWPEQKK